MDGWTKFKEWVNENAPFLANVYSNKYVGMAYDRFASLPANQQKQSLFGVVGGLVFIVVAFLFISYLSLWSSSDKASTSSSMVAMLEDYQRTRRDKGTQISNLERNNQLASPGQFKQTLVEAARSAGISPRLVQVEEKGEGDEAGGDQTSREVKLKRATVNLQRVNLSQLRSFLSNVEFGIYNLSVSSIKITNDNKIRGYMNVDLGVVAYLFQAEEGA